jgi:hypothetical protein
MEDSLKDRLEGILEKGVSVNTAGYSLGYLAQQACDYLNKNYKSDGIHAEFRPYCNVDVYHVLKSDKVVTFMFDELGISFSQDTLPEDFAFVAAAFRDVMVHIRDLAEN